MARHRGGRLPARPDQLQTCTLIRNPRQDWQPWLAAAGVATVRANGPSVDDAGLALDLAVRGDGIALARSLLAGADIEAGRLRPLFDIAVRDRFAYWLIVRPGVEKRPEALAVGAWIRDECARSVAPHAMRKTLKDGSRFAQNRNV
jgi:LysR family transcriptional regulator, glycine cleavage system transcriptional activator